MLNSYYRILGEPLSNIVLLSASNIRTMLATFVICLFCFRSLIVRLETIDPRKMKHEEKLAFWINVHNALVMHVMNFIS